MARKTVTPSPLPHRAPGLTSTTKVIVDDGGDGVLETTWGQFITANSDSLGQTERMAIALKLSVGDPHTGGGGAEPAWSIRRAP